MELVALAKDILQSIAETTASYRFGQSILRHLDRTLWVVEKCARWAVPPPLDEDDRPQPELVRPLPWVFFLALIVALRISRESISLLNLLMGKPPLRSADVVMFLQSKRRYLRTLKYQGNRIMRARTSGSRRRQSWWNALQSLFDFTMCFRRHSPRYRNNRNNNTTRVSNNDEVLVVKRHKRSRSETGTVATSSETSMERLIEKMMVDLDAESDEDASFTLTNATSPKSDRSDFTQDSDQDTAFYNNTSDISNESENNASDQNADMNEASSQIENNNSMSDKNNSIPEKTSSQSEKTNSTPEKTDSPSEKTSSTSEKTNSTSEETDSPSEKTNASSEKSNSPPEKTKSSSEKTNSPSEKPISSSNHTSAETKNKNDSKSQDSSSKIPRTTNNEQKIANGRTVNSASDKGTNKEKDGRRPASDRSKNA